MQEAVKALLLTDLVDSTQLVETLGVARTAELWAAHDRVARDLLEQHGGREIDKTDGFLLLFDDAAAAARYALDYHRSLGELSQELGMELAARVGLHVGAVALRENAAADVARGAKPLELEGLAKPAAARIMSIALGGQTLLSEAARAAVGEDVPEGAEFESRGHWRLKGVAEPIQLHELGVRGLSPFEPPPDAQKAYRVVERSEPWLPLREVPRSLPAEQDAFVGRESELQELAHRFEGGARLLTVLGAGGAGKTRLVTRHAWTWLGDYPGGAWFCDLSEARSLEGIVRALAATLGVSVGKEDPVVQLGHAIASRGRCLVIFDNFEQVAEHAGATVENWLTRAKDAHFLVTSRVLLNLQAEAIMNVEPLPVETAAIELFELRARAKKPEFRVVDENREDVAALVKLVDGLPLAIELAAARVRVMSPAKLVERMADRFALLGGARGARQRQATLEAAIDWSWDLLSPWEQAALAQASVFEGGFTLEAAEAVIDLSAWDEAPWPLDSVQALVDKSLLRTWTPEFGDSRHDIAEPYFGMYVSIHEYAAAKLASEEAIAGGGSGAAAENAAHERHGEHFAAYGTEEALRTLKSRAGLERRQSLALELDNLIVACRRAVEREDGPTALATLRAAWAVMQSRGPFRLGITLARSVLTLPGLTDPERAGGRAILAKALLQSGQLEEALACLEDSAAVHRELDDRHGEALVRADLGVIHTRLGRLDEARACLDEALAVFREQADRQGEAQAIGDLGNLHYLQGEPEQARACLETALALNRELGDRKSEGMCIGNLGSQHHVLGRLEEARKCYEAATLIHREVGNRLSEGLQLGNLGLLNAGEDRLEEALECYESAIAIHRELGNRRSEGIALGDLGNLHLRRGRPEEARPCLDIALAIHVEVGNRRSEGAVIGSLGALYLSEDRIEEARASLDASLSILREVGDHLMLGRTLCMRGQLERRTGEDALARVSLAEAEALAAQVGAGPDSALGRSIAELGQALEEKR